MIDSAEELRRQLEQAKQQIEKVHQEWMAALDAVDTPIFLHDREFRILRANRAYQQCAGIPFKQIIGRPYFEIFPKMASPLAECRQEAGGKSEEEIVLSGRVYHSKIFTVNDEQGEYLYGVHSLVDVTDWKEMVESLSDSHRLLHSVIENAPARIFWKDKDLHYLGCNTAFARDAGWPTPEEVAGKDDFQMEWRDMAEMYRADDRRVIETDTPKLGLEEPMPVSDGNVNWVRTSRVPMHDANGKVNAVLGFYDDITEWRETEEKLRDSEQRHRLLFESSRDALMTSAPPNWAFSNANAAALTLFGADSADEFKTLGPQDVSPERQPDGVLSSKKARKMIAIALRKGSHFFEWQHQRLDGQTFLADVLLTHMSIGRNHFLLASVRDISERKKHELALRRANLALHTISAGNQALIHASDEQHLLQEMCRVAIEVGGYHKAWVGYAEDDAEKSVRPMASFGFEPGHLESAGFTWADNERGQGLTCRTIRSGKYQLAQDARADAELLPWGDKQSLREVAACISLPLLDGDRCFGAFTIYDDDPRAFAPDEVAILDEMTSDLAFGILDLRMRKAHFEHEQHLQKNMLQTVEAIANIVEMRDPYTSGHQFRVADLARHIAQTMHLSDDEVQAVHLAGLVHDLGKIRIPAEILSKPSKLNEIEFNLIKMHPRAGYDILHTVEFSWPIAQMVLQHHERMDGSGYPQGLQGEAILLGARILSVADVVEAIASHRPYRPGLGIDAALNEIRLGRGMHYDVQVVDACIALFNDGNYQLPSLQDAI